MSDGDELTLWVLYEKPLDFPDEWIIRGHDLHLASGTITVRNEFLRGKYRGSVVATFELHRPDAVWIGRNPGDEPQIVGVWV